MRPNVSALLKELCGLPTYIEISAPLKEDISALSTSLKVAVEAKMGKLGRVEVEEATMLKNAIMTVGWAEEDMARLGALVDNQVDYCTPIKRVRRCTQRCDTWEYCPIESDWRLLCDKTTP